MLTLSDDQKRAGCLARLLANKIWQFFCPAWADTAEYSDFLIILNSEHIYLKLRKMIFQFVFRINHLQRFGIYFQRSFCLHVFRITNDKGIRIQFLENRPTTLLQSWRKPWFGAHFLHWKRQSKLLLSCVLYAGKEVGAYHMYFGFSSYNLEITNQQIECFV